MKLFESGSISIGAQPSSSNDNAFNKNLVHYEPNVCLVLACDILMKSIL
jgi:hypothetical protein